MRENSLAVVFTPNTLPWGAKSPKGRDKSVRFEVRIRRKWEKAFFKTCVHLWPPCAAAGRQTGFTHSGLRLRLGYSVPTTDRAFPPWQEASTWGLS